MSNQQLVALVAEMREAQKEFFRTRSKTALDASRGLEKQVDKAVRKALNPTPSLFPDEDPS
jgi:hypothetical protein